MTVIEELRGILNTPKPAEDCRCENCSKASAETVFSCELCGYAGKPAMLTCACYDIFCGGATVNRSGTGCFHGCPICPICDDGEAELDPWQIVRLARTLLVELAYV